MVAQSDDTQRAVAKTSAALGVLVQEMSSLGPSTTVVPLLGVDDPMLTQQPPALAPAVAPDVATISNGQGPALVEGQLPERFEAPAPIAAPSDLAADAQELTPELITNLEPPTGPSIEQVPAPVGPAASDFSPPLPPPPTAPVPEVAAVEMPDWGPPIVVPDTVAADIAAQQAADRVAAIVAENMAAQAEEAQAAQAAQRPDPLSLGSLIGDNSDSDGDDSSGDADDEAAATSMPENGPKVTRAVAAALTKSHTPGGRSVDRPVRPGSGSSPSGPSR